MKRLLLTAIALLVIVTSCGTPQVVQVTVPVEQTKIVQQTVPVEVTKEVVVTAPAQAGACSCQQCGGILTFGIDSWQGLDPRFAPSDWSYEAISQIFSFLVRATKITPPGEAPVRKPVPDLAKSWDISADGKTIIFHLRTDYRWQDGNEVFPEGKSRPVDAHDVVYSFKRQLEPGGWVQADFKKTYQDIEAIDDYTVKLTLNSPDPLLFYWSRGFNGFAIVPHEAVEKYGEDGFKLHPIGSGPFEVQSYQPDQELNLKVNEDYWIKPCIDGVRFIINKDTNALLVAFEAGDIDIYGTILPIDAINRYKDDPRFVLQPYGCDPGSWYLYQVDQPPFNDIRFRKAMALATDGAAIGQAVWGSAFYPNAGIAHKGVPGYVADSYTKYYTYNPDEAKKLLDEMGIVDTNGDGKREWQGKNLEIPYFVQGAEPFPALAEGAAAAAAKIGITLKPTVLDDAGLLDKIQKGEWGIKQAYGFCTDGGTATALGQDNLYWGSGYKDDQIIDLVNQSIVEMDPVKRDQILQQITTRVDELYWFNWFGSSVLTFGMRSYVKEYTGQDWYVNLATPETMVWIAQDEK